MMKKSCFQALKGLASLLLLVPLASYSREENKKEEGVGLEEVAVKAPRLLEEKIKLSIRPETFPTKVEVTTGEELEKIVIFRPEELFRKKPGVHVENYGQGDIGFAITMRGSEGGGGNRRYVAIYVDDVPHNYIVYFSNTVIPWVIPEFVDRIYVIKGPFSPLCGENAIAGCVNIYTKDVLKNSVSLSLGSFGSYRILPTFGYSWSRGSLYLLGEFYRTDGYRENSNYERKNFFSKTNINFGGHNLAFSLGFYEADWNAPGYLPLSELKRGLVNRRTSLVKDQKDGGDSRFLQAVVRLTPRDERGLYSTVYINALEINRFVAFPPSVNAPVRQQARILDQMSGGMKTYYSLDFGRSLNLMLGGEFRYEEGDNLRYRTDRRQRVAPTDIMNWHAIYRQFAFFNLVQFKPHERIKLLGGFRYDFYDFDVQNKVRPHNSGGGEVSVFSPKVGVVLSPSKDVDLFANWSKGGRVPYINEVSPHNAPANFNLKASEISSWDIGFNASLLRRFLVSATYYDTRIEREIGHNIANEPVNIGKTERKGAELETRFLITPTTYAYASYSIVDARVLNPTVPGQTKVIDTPKNIVKIGLDYSRPIDEVKSLSFGLSYYYISGRYYYEDGSARLYKGPVYDRLEAYVNYEHSSRLNLALSATHVPRKFTSQITWLNGTEIMVNPEPQWTFNLSVRYNF